MNMENSKKPAFSTGPEGWTQKSLNERLHYGLTKREYFAAMAMQGICGAPVNSSHVGKEMICRASIEIAEELLKQLGNE